MTRQRVVRISEELGIHMVNVYNWREIYCGDGEGSSRRKHVEQMNKLGECRLFLENIRKGGRRGRPHEYQKG